MTHTNDNPLWRDSYPDKQMYPTISQDIAVDVAVVGGGITGLTTAYLLKQSGYKVVVLEKDTLGAGTTGRTTGKVTSQHGLIYHDMKERLGDKTARIYGEANQAAVEMVNSIVSKEGIDCNWHMHENYVFTDDPRKVSRLKEEAETAKRLGLPASYTTSTSLPFPVEGAIKFRRQGLIHSVKYLLGLADHINGGGSSVHENSRVLGIRDGDTCRITTKQATITAKYVVVATHIPTFPLVARAGYAILEYPTESFAIVGRTDEKATSGMYISPDKHHYSILPIKLDGKHYLVVVGAGGNIPGIRISKKARYQLLIDYAKKHFNLTEVTHCWSDMDYIAYDHFPLVGKLYPWSRHVLTATGFMKWGLTNGTVAAMILRDSITGNENPWASAYDSMRTRPITSIPWAVKKHFSSK